MPTARIGFLIPEYPGQTHIFFRREMLALAKLDVEVGVVSTRRPPAALVSHSWSSEAIRATTYLTPVTTAQLGSASLELLRAGFGGWWRTLRAIATGNGSILARLKRLPMVWFGAALAGVVRRRGWSHLHVHSCANAADLAMFANLLAGQPYSLTLHGPLAYFGPNQRQKWKHAAFALVITQRLRDEVNDQLSGALPPRLVVAPMGVDVDVFRRTRPYQPWTAGPVRLFACGRLNPGKGHDDVIRAAAILARRGFDVKLRIAGQTDSGRPEYLDELRRLTVDCGIGERVDLLGAVSEETVRDELEQSHVFALGSHEEALGVAIMEAMAMELPVVVTNVGGVPELVRNEVNGLLVPAQNGEFMAQRISDVLRDPVHAQNLGRAARETVSQEFHAGISAERLITSLSN